MQLASRLNLIAAEVFGIAAKITSILLEETLEACRYCGVMPILSG